jgi:hypothetical protein
MQAFMKVCIAGIICHLADFSIKVGIKLKWNPEKEIIIGDTEVSILVGEKILTS